MFENLLEAVWSSGPAVLASAGGAAFVWSFSLVSSTIRLGRIPERAHNVAFWSIGLWHVLAATSLTAVLGVQNVLLAFLGGCAFTQVLGLYVADGDMEICYRTFDENADRVDGGMDQSVNDSADRHVIHIDAA